MTVKVHHKHLDQLCKLLGLSRKLQSKKTRGHADMEIPDSSTELVPHDASLYRTCVEILLYLSADLPQCQYVIRYLSTFSSKPTQKSLVVLKHLVGYMSAHADQCMGSLCPRHEVRMVPLFRAMRACLWKFQRLGVTRRIRLLCTALCTAYTRVWRCVVRTPV